MATWEDVARIALALPETDEGISRDLRHWRMKDRGFVWERPLRRSDLEALGDAAPDRPEAGRPGRAPRRQGGAPRRRPGRLLHHAALRRLSGRPRAPGPRPRRSVRVPAALWAVGPRWLAWHESSPASRAKSDGGAESSPPARLRSDEHTRSFAAAVFSNAGGSDVRPFAVTSPYVRRSPRPAGPTVMSGKRPFAGFCLSRTPKSIAATRRSFPAASGRGPHDRAHRAQAATSFAAVSASLLRAVAIGTSFGTLRGSVARSRSSP